MLAQPTLQPQDRPPQALKDFPLRSFIYHLPLTPFRPADGPRVLPLTSPKSRARLCTYPGLCPEPRGLPRAPPSPLHHPPSQGCNTAPPLPPPRGRKQIPALSCSNPHSASHIPRSQDPSAWGRRAGCGPSSAVGPVLQERSWKANPELPRVQMPLDAAPAGAPSRAEPWPRGLRCS